MQVKKVSLITKRKKRLLLVNFVLVIIFAVLAGRLLYLMVFESKKLKLVSASQWTSDVKIGAKRGNILDRNGHELAVSIDIYRIDLDLATLRQTLKTEGITTEKLTADLSSILNMKPEDVRKALDKTLANGLPASWSPLKRQVEKPEADKVKALNLFGILVSLDTKRYYPRENFLSNVIGHIDDKGDGITGIEQMYNEELSGEEGRLIYERDNKSNQLFFENSRYTQPIGGKSLELTIDEVIQGYAEKAAEKAINENKAKGVSIMVMNPKNGEILAIANKPDYDPNDSGAGTKTSDELQSTWKNPSVENIFEPGSIFKVITAAASMEYGTSKANDKFVCKGSLKVAGRTINCWDTNGHGTENFIDILKNSCNVGFMQVGKSLGKDNLYSFAKKLGFGQKTGIDLPGEAAGILKKPTEMNDVDLATESFGQSISVTQVQYMAAFNAIANGGTWIKPHIMKDVVHFDENNKLIIERNFNDYQQKQVLDTELTSTLRTYLEKVVSEGVGINAYLKGYGIAGKTGTAQKVSGNGYGDKKYMSSFAGLAPTQDPKVTLIVTIDEPDASNYYAGQVAAPVAKELFNDIFNYAAINPNILGDNIIKK